MSVPVERRGFERDSRPLRGPDKAEAVVVRELPARAPVRLLLQGVRREERRWTEELRVRPDPPSLESRSEFRVAGNQGSSTLHEVEGAEVEWSSLVELGGHLVQDVAAPVDRPSARRRADHRQGSGLVEEP